MAWSKATFTGQRRSGPFPGILVCLGVVPFGVDDPQVPVLGRALARAGFAALLYWSPAMRDFRLDPGNVEEIALAYRWLTEQPTVDPARSGLIGTCVGGAFRLDGGGQPAAYATAPPSSLPTPPYSSMWTFTPDIASATPPVKIGVSRGGSTR